MTLKDAFFIIFWGYLIVMLDFYIIVDVLPDPIGYFLIYLGIEKIVKDFPIGKKSKVLSLMLVIISVPFIFLNQTTEANNLLNFSFMTLYTLIVDIAGLVLVFYTFQLIFEIAKEYGDQVLYRRSFWTGTIYFVIVFIIYILGTFVINLRPLDSLLAITGILFTAIFIMHFLFS